MTKIIHHTTLSKQTLMVGGDQCWSTSIDILRVLPSPTNPVVINHDNSSTSSPPTPPSILLVASKQHSTITLYDIIKPSSSQQEQAFTTRLSIRGQLKASTINNNNNNSTSLLCIQDICVIYNPSMEFEQPQQHELSNDGSNDSSGDNKQKPLIGCSYSDGTIRLWNWQTLECEKVLQGHTDSVLSLDCSLDGSLLISSSKDGSMRLWNVNNGTCLKKINQNHRNAHHSSGGSAGGSINSVRFVKNSLCDDYGQYKVLSYSSGDGCIKMWNVSSTTTSNCFQCICTIEGKHIESWNNHCQNILLTPDSSFFSFSGLNNSLECIELVGTNFMKSLFTISLKDESSPISMKFVVDYDSAQWEDPNWGSVVVENSDVDWTTGSSVVVVPVVEVKEEEVNYLSTTTKKATGVLTAIDMCYSPTRYWLSHVDSSGMLVTTDLETKSIVNSTDIKNLSTSTNSDDSFNSFTGFDYGSVGYNGGFNGKKKKKKKQKPKAKSLVWSIDGSLLFVGNSDGSMHIFEVSEEL